MLWNIWACYINHYEWRSKKHFASELLENLEEMFHRWWYWSLAQKKWLYLCLVSKGLNILCGIKQYLLQNYLVRLSTMTMVTHLILPVSTKHLFPFPSNIIKRTLQFPWNFEKNCVCYYTQSDICSIYYTLILHFTILPYLKTMLQFSLV